MPYSADPSRYDDMAYRRVGRSGLKLPAVSLGIWQNFGSVTPYETSRAILLRAFDLGVTHIDAANNYGPVPGSAEETLGPGAENRFGPLSGRADYLHQSGLRHVARPLWGLGKPEIHAGLPRPEPETPGAGVCGYFLFPPAGSGNPSGGNHGRPGLRRRAGKALYVGVSNYSAEQTRQAAAILRQMGVPCLIHQPRYNMFDRWIEDGLQDVLDEEGMGSIAFSPLAQGLLTDRYLGGIPADSRAARGAFLKEADITPARLDVIRKLNGIAAERGQSLAQMAIAWILRGGRVTSALVGASSVGQLENNLGALRQLEFTADELGGH